MSRPAIASTEIPADDNIARRQLPDRRRQDYTGVNLRHIGLRPRRQHNRRATDSANGYVDWYEAHLLFSGLGILACCCLDAFFTLKLLQMGATELNSLMAYLIETDVQHFVNFKIAMTGLSVILLVIHKNFVLFKVRVSHMLHVALGAYLTLIGYELILLANPPL